MTAIRIVMPHHSRHDEGRSTRFAQTPGWLIGPVAYQAGAGSVLVGALALGEVVLDQVHHRRIGECGDVADLTLLCDVPEQPAHDLSGPGLRQFGDDHDLPRLRD